MGRESQVPLAQASRWPRRRCEVNAAAPSRCQQTRSLPGKFLGGRACVLLFLRTMQRELSFSTIDFLIKTIEAKDAEMEDADEDTALHLLESEMTNLQRRLHVEFCYLSAFADGDGQAH